MRSVDALKLKRGTELTTGCRRVHLELDHPIRPHMKQRRTKHSVLPETGTAPFQPVSSRRQTLAGTDEKSEP